MNQLLLSDNKEHREGDTLEDLIKPFGHATPAEIDKYAQYYIGFPGSEKRGMRLVEKAREIVRYEQAIEKLNNGESVFNSEGGTSMLPTIKPYQKVRISPIPDKSLLKMNDIVLAKVNGRYMMHKISAIQGKRIQISNNHGHVNGWTTRAKIYGIVDAIYPME